MNQKKQEISFAKIVGGKNYKELLKKNEQTCKIFKDLMNN
jgi:hypothetical protein